MANIFHNERSNWCNLCQRISTSGFPRCVLGLRFCHKTCPWLAKDVRGSVNLFHLKIVTLTNWFAINEIKARWLITLQPPPPPSHHNMTDTPPLPATAAKDPSSKPAHRATSSDSNTSSAKSASALATNQSNPSGSPNTARSSPSPLRALPPPQQ